MPGLLFIPKDNNNNIYFLKENDMRESKSKPIYPTNSCFIQCKTPLRSLVASLLDHHATLLALPLSRLLLPPPSPFLCFAVAKSLFLGSQSIYPSFLFLPHLSLSVSRCNHCIHSPPGISILGWLLKLYITHFHNLLFSLCKNGFHISEENPPLNSSNQAPPDYSIPIFSLIFPTPRFRFLRRLRLIVVTFFLFFPFRWRPRNHTPPFSLLRRPFSSIRPLHIPPAGRFCRRN